MADSSVSAGINRISAINVHLSNRTVVKGIGECVMVPVPIHCFRTLNQSSATQWGTSWGKKSSEHLALTVWLVDGTTIYDTSTKSSNGTSFAILIGTHLT